MGWRWMRLTGRWNTSRGRCGAACSPARTPVFQKGPPSALIPGMESLSSPPGFPHSLHTKEATWQDGASGKVQGTE